MSHIIIYDKKEIIKNWNYFYYNFESFDFEYLSDKEAISDWSSELSGFFNEHILSLLTENEDIYKKTKQIREIIEKNKISISFSDAKVIKDNLEAMYEKFKSIENIDYFVSLTKQMELNIKIAQAEVKARSNKILGEHSIGELDKEFSIVYDDMKTYLFLKQALFYFIVFFSIIYLTYAIKETGVSDFKNLSIFLLVRLTISFPFVIVILFLWGQIKRDNQIVQVYLHKKSVIRSYLNYSHTINQQKFGEGDKEIKDKMIGMLLNAVIEVLRENPSNSILKTNEKLDVNYQNIIEKLIDKFPNLK